MPWPSPASVATSNSLCLNPFQSEQLAEFQAKRREAMMSAEGESFDPTRLPEIIKQLKEEGQTRLAGFLTPDQVDQYKESLLSLGSSHEHGRRRRFRSIV
jgi:hypothetical protein